MTGAAVASRLALEASAGKLTPGAILETVTSITGSVPDILAGIDVVRGWVQAQDGLAWAPHAFVVTAAAQPAETAASPERSSGDLRPAPAGRRTRDYMPAELRPPVPAEDRRPPGILGGQNANIGGGTTPFLTIRTEDGESVAAFSVSHREITRNVFACRVGLSQHKNFDSAFGSQAAASFAGEAVEVPDAGVWQVLAFSGWGNRLGVAFRSFHGMVLVGVGKYRQPFVLPSSFTSHDPEASGRIDVGWDERNGFVLEL